MNAKNISDRSMKDLCVAIITQAIDDYDKVLYAYFSNAKDPETKLLIPFTEFDYIESLDKPYKSKREEKEISKVESFFDSDWFSLIVAQVGGYHQDQIKNSRRKIIARQALKDGVIKKRMLFEVFKLNNWEELPF